MLIDQLLEISNRYLNSIAKNIKLYLEEHDKFCLSYYLIGVNSISIHEVIQNENDAIEFGASHARLTPMFNLLRKKYAIVSELIYILNGIIREKQDEKMIILANEASENLRLITFAQTFTDSITIFKTRLYHPANSLFSSPFTNETLEDQFIAICENIAKQTDISIYPSY